MSNPWALDDLLADLIHARKQGDLGRMAIVAYCDVRRWARDEGRSVLADKAAGLITQCPHQSCEAFLAQIDELVVQLESLQRAKLESAPAHASPSFWSMNPMLSA